MSAAASIRRDPSTLSLIERLATMPRDHVERVLADLDDNHVRVLSSWEATARPQQLPPAGEWIYWVILAGRGWGKTRTGAEWICRCAREPERYRRGVIANETRDEVVRVNVLGESGVLAVSDPAFRPRHVSRQDEHKLVWPNGFECDLLYGSTPEKFRGPNYGIGWLDELAKYRYASQVLEIFELTLRAGRDPRCLVTTTPRPVPAIVRLVNDRNAVVIRGTSYENAANLPPVFIERIVRRLEGTRVGRQEIYGELLLDLPGALWRQAWFDRDRVDVAPPLGDVVVAIDPAATSRESSAETGIVAAGIGIHDGRIYVIADRSGRMRPEEWADEAIQLALQVGASRIVAEANNGGEMVRAMIAARLPRHGLRLFPVELVWATRGKYTRAEPIAALYERGMVSHVKASGLDQLESQLCCYTPRMDQRERIVTDIDPSSPSPDRGDALVWAIWSLITRSSGARAGDLYDDYDDAPAVSISPY